MSSYIDYWPCPVSTDITIAIIFGVTGTVITVFGLAIAYRQLREMVNGKSRGRCLLNSSKLPRIMADDTLESSLPVYNIRLEHNFASEFGQSTLKSPSCPKRVGRGKRLRHKLWTFFWVSEIEFGRRICSELLYRHIKWHAYILFRLDRVESFGLKTGFRAEPEASRFLALCVEITYGSSHPFQVSGSDIISLGGRKASNL